MQATTLSHIASLFRKQAKGIDWAIVLVPEGSNEGSSLFPRQCVLSLIPRPFREGPGNGATCHTHPPTPADSIFCSSPLPSRMEVGVADLLEGLLPLASPSPTFPNPPSSSSSSAELILPAPSCFFIRALISFPVYVCVCVCCGCEWVLVKY